MRGVDLERAEMTICELGKSTRKSRPNATNECKISTMPLDLVHSDVVGPMTHETYGGAKYFVTLYDNSSGLSLVRFIQGRTRVLYALRDMVKEIETTRC